MVTKNNRNVMILAAVIILLIIGVIMTNKGKVGGTTAAALTAEEAQTKATSFINDTLLTGDTTATVQEITAYNKGVYAMKVKLSNSEELIDSYMTKDGALFFPQGLDVIKMTAEAGGNTNTADTNTADTQAQPTTTEPQADGE